MKWDPELTYLYGQWFEKGIKRECMRCLFEKRTRKRK